MTDDASVDQRPSFDSQVLLALEGLPPAERRMARFFIDQKQAVLLGSAGQIARQAGGSDATVVRTARALGFQSLAALREVLLTELTGAPTPRNRLQHTLDEAGSDAAGMLRHVVDIHQNALEALNRPEFAASFARAIDILAAAKRRHVFGIGPSGALAEYASLQFNRIGLATNAMTASGVALADRLLWLGQGDAVLMLAYGPLYREVEIVIDQAHHHKAPVILVSDDLGAVLGERVAETLPVPRGKADHLAMHAGTMVLIEAMVIGLASKSRDTAFDSLNRLSGLRGSIDKTWNKRGVRTTRRK